MSTGVTERPKQPRCLLCGAPLRPILAAPAVYTTCSVCDTAAPLWANHGDGSPLPRPAAVCADLSIKAR